MITPRLSGLFNRASNTLNHGFPLKSLSHIPLLNGFGVSKDGQCLHSRVYGTDICCTPQTLGSKLGSIRNIHYSSQNEFEAGRNNFVGRENPRKWPDPSSDPAHSGSFSSRFSPLENPRNNRPMNAVMGIMQGDRKDMMGFSPRVYNIENNADIVHIKVMRNNSFVTVTDSKGNKKIGASSGSLSEMKGGSKGSRYSAEAAAEHIGRTAENMGIKSVVMKVNGFTYFKKKKQAILSFRDGYTNSRTDQNPIVHIEDTTRKPHNGCRLRKKTRK